MTSYPELSSGILDGPVHLASYRVYYEDTDAGGIVYHANYLRWFERARSDMLRLIGIDQNAALEAGEGGYAVADMAIRYRLPARFDDVINVETRGEDVRAASISLQQIARRGGDLICEARLKVGFVGPDGRPRRQPKAWRDALNSVISTPERQI